MYIYIYWVCFACCVSCRLNWPVQANSAASFSSPHRAAVRLGLKTSHTDRCANRKFETMVKIQTVESALSRWSKVKRCQEALISCWCTAKVEALMLSVESLETHWWAKCQSCCSPEALHLVRIEDLCGALLQFLSYLSNLSNPSRSRASVSDVPMCEDSWKRKGRQPR